MIDREHREIYDRDGVVRLAAAFDARWVTRLTQAFDRLQALVRAGSPLPHSGEPGVKPADGDHDPHTGKAHLRNAAPHDADVRVWAHESPAAEIVARLLGSDRVQLAFQPKPYSFNGYYTQADGLSPGARPPFDFLPVLPR